jgi:hypothetical protein
MSHITLRARPPLHLGELSDHEAIDKRLIAAFVREQGGPASHQSHFELGRYENSYIDRTAIPEIEPLIAAAREAAQSILGRTDLKLGFWFNAMQPGDRTARHNHEEEDELLSCVYYLQTAPGCGDLLVHHAGGTERIAPSEGRFVFFSPKLAHEVEENRSGQQRLSVAFNFGPANG